MLVNGCFFQCKIATFINNYVRMLYQSKCTMLLQVALAAVACSKNCSERAYFKMYFVLIVVF